MNERIEKLIEQATETSTSYFDGRGNITETYFDKEKFAELIIRECAQIAAKNQAEDMGWDISEIIKEHFGVEE